MNRFYQCWVVKWILFLFICVNHNDVIGQQVSGRSPARASAPFDSPFLKPVSRVLRFNDLSGTEIFSTVAVECPMPEEEAKKSFFRDAWISNENWLSGETVPCFPPGIPISRQTFKNWAGNIHIRNVWTAVPRTPEEVLLIANWAASSGYKLRPRGYMHNWSPLTLSPDDSACDKVVLIDTTKHLTKMKMASMSLPAAVTVQTGASLDNLLAFLEVNGFGIASHPSSGDLTIGGIIAVGGHGTGLPIQGQSYGSVSNLVLSLNAVVWNDVDESFEIRSFNRSEPDTRALLVNIGRIFLTEVTLRVTPMVNKRFISSTNIPASELFADPSKAGPKTRTFSTLLNKYGSVEVTWFPFISSPWLKVWNVAPTKPDFSREVQFPYNDYLTNSLPEIFNPLIKKHIARNWKSLTMLMAQIGYLGTLAGTSDIWGPSKNVLLYVKSTTLQVSGVGYAVITNLVNVQLILNRFAIVYDSLLEEYAEQGLYPINAGVDIRVTGLDDPQKVGIDMADAQPPSLSPLAPIPDRPDLDTAIWLNVLSIPGTRNATNFLNKIELFLLNNLPPALAIVRPEWAKGWAYTEDFGWSNKEILNKIPGAYNDWDFAISTFKKYDPKQVFTSSLTAALLS